MPYDDVQKFSEAAVNKAKLLKEHPGKYFLAFRVRIHRRLGLLHHVQLAAAHVPCRRHHWRHY